MTAETKTPLSRKVATDTLVLLIDNNAFSRFLMRRALEKSGFHVVGARSKLDAADVLGEGATPDAVVLADLDGRRDRAWRLVYLPNARAERAGARLSGSMLTPDLARPLTAPQLVEALVGLLLVLRPAQPAAAESEPRAA